MGDSFKRVNLGVLAFVHEAVEGISNFEVAATGTSGGGSEDTIIASVDDSVDDEFIGYQVYIKTATNTANEGQVRTITDYSAISGFTLDSALPAVTTTGDVFYMFSFLPAKSVSPDIQIEMLEREFETLSYDKPCMVPGLKTWTLSADVEVPGLESPSDSATQPGIDRFSNFLQVIGKRSAPAGNTVGAGATMSNIPLSDANEFEVGSLVQINGEVRVVSAVNTGPDSIDVKPDLTNTPTAGTVVYSAECFTPAETGHRSVTFICVKDDQLYLMKGGKVSISGTFNWGTLAMLSFEADGTEWDIIDSFDAFGGFHSANKAPAVVKGAALFGLDEPEGVLLASEVEWDISHTREETRDSGVGGAGNIFKITDRNSTIRIKERTANATTFVRLENGTFAELLAYAGEGPGSTLAIYGQGQYESVSISDSAGIVAYDGQLRQVDNHTEADKAYKLLFCRF